MRQIWYGRFADQFMDVDMVYVEQANRGNDSVFSAYSSHEAFDINKSQHTVARFIVRPRTTSTHSQLTK